MEFGKDKVLYIRLLKNKNTQIAHQLADQIEHVIDVTNTINNKAVKKSTAKGGKVINKVYSGVQTTTLKITAIATNDEVNATLMEAALNQEYLEAFEVDLSRPHAEKPNQFECRYMVGLLDSWSMPANVEETVDIETTLQVNGAFENTYFTVPEEDLEMFEYAEQVDGGVLTPVDPVEP